MIIQWCIKGLALDDDSAAKSVLDEQQGILCNWWRSVNTITPPEIRAKLTPDNLNVHVNHFTLNGFDRMTPFISLSAGTVERDAIAQTNMLRRARRTALWFGSDFGRRREAYLYTCWVMLAPRPAVEIEAVGEEIRDLNTYRRYSAFQTEGEVTAKVSIPDNQIQSCEKWEWGPPGIPLRRTWTYPNPRFDPPERLSNVRELI